MKIENGLYLTRGQTSDAWQMYTDAFKEINALAVQAHLMTWEQFSEIADDERIQKWQAFDDAGALAGLSVITDDLDAWPLISPQYFERHYPELYEARRIFYVGFVCVRQHPRASAHTFPALVNAMKQQVIDVAGMAVMDFCSLNVDFRHLPRGTTAILANGDDEVRHARLDAQEYHAWHWAGDILC